MLLILVYIRTKCSPKICEGKIEKKLQICQGFFIVRIKPENVRLSSFSLNHCRATAKRTGREETHNKHKLKFITDAQYTNCHTDMSFVCRWTVNMNACTGTKTPTTALCFLTAHLLAPLISFFIYLTCAKSELLSDFDNQSRSSEIQK